MKNNFIMFHHYFLYNIFLEDFYNNHLVIFINFFLNYFQILKLIIIVNHNQPKFTKI